MSFLKSKFCAWRVDANPGDRESGYGITFPFLLVFSIGLQTQNVSKAPGDVIVKSNLDERMDVNPGIKRRESKK